MLRTSVASRILGSGWIIAALGIAIDLASDVGKVGLTDLDSSLKWAFGASVIAVTFAATNAILLYSEAPKLRWIVVGISSLFVFYLASFLLFGGEGTALVRFIVPLAFLLLAIWTIRVAWGWRMQGQSLDP
jgi:hypothetical protein